MQDAGPLINVEPRKSRRVAHLHQDRQDFANAHFSHVFSEVIAKDRIAVAQEVARELGKGKCLAQLLSGPICGRVGGHIEVQDATPVVGQHQKYVKDLEPDGGHGEEVDRDQLLGMILQEGAPSLRRRFAAAHHIFADTAVVRKNSIRLPCDRDVGTYLSAYVTWKAREASSAGRKYPSA